MSGDELRVTTAHLADLAAQQSRAAAETRSATSAVDGVDAAVRTSHGSVASATAGALEAVLAARSSAGTKVAGISDALCDKLSDAAKRYAKTDDASSSALGAQMQTG
jgi:hypothetical protein